MRILVATLLFLVPMFNQMINYECITVDNATNICNYTFFGLSRTILCLTSQCVIHGECVRHISHDETQERWNEGKRNLQRAATRFEALEMRANPDEGDSVVHTTLMEDGSKGRLKPLAHYDNKDKPREWSWRHFVGLVFACLGLLLAAGGGIGGGGILVPIYIIVMGFSPKVCLQLSLLWFHGFRGIKKRISHFCFPAECFFVHDH